MENNEPGLVCVETVFVMPDIGRVRQATATGPDFIARRPGGTTDGDNPAFRDLMAQAAQIAAPEVPVVSVPGCS